MNLFTQPDTKSQWVFTPTPKLNTYYVIATSSVWRLIWVNRMGRVYRYNFQSQEFIRDDIVEDLESDWYLYSRIILKETERLAEAQEMIEPDIIRSKRKDTIEFVLLPLNLLFSILDLFVFLPLKFKIRKLKKIFLK